MGNFDRPVRKRPLQPLPARLNRLDYEMMVTKEKDHDYIYAVGKGCRFKVCVMRNEDHRCFATAQVGSKALRVQGGYSASGAYLLCVVAIKRAFGELPEAEKAAVRLENPLVTSQIETSR